MTDQTKISAAVDEYAAAKVADQKSLDDASYKALKDEYDAYRVAHPAGPDVPVEPPTSSGWTLKRTVDLTKEPAGTTYTTGVRNTDASYNTKANAAWTSNGLVITCAKNKTTGRLESADVMMRGITFGPGDMAIEVDFRLDGYLGAGSFPCPLWLRPSGAGAGEWDLLEYKGKNVGTQYEATFGFIKTGTPYNQGQDMHGIPKALVGGSFGGKLIRLRHEKKGDTVTVLIGLVKVDGTATLTKAGQITKAGLDAQAGAGSWDAQAKDFAGYPRVTYQAGIGAGASAAGAMPTGGYPGSIMTISRLAVYVPA